MLFQRIQFAVKVNPFADIAYGLYKGQFLNAVSVGFIPIEWNDEKADGEMIRNYTRQELVEVSAVPVPANRDALRIGLRASGIPHGTIRDALRLLADAMEEDSDCERAEAHHRSLWDLEFARELRAAMQ